MLKVKTTTPIGLVEWINAAGEYTDADGTSRRVAVSLGPEHGTVGQFLRLSSSDRPRLRPTGLRGEACPTEPSQKGAATLTRENNGSPAVIGEKSSANMVQMWCTAPLDAPRGADFSPSHICDLDFLLT
jgi:hypothetical protein